MFLTRRTCEYKVVDALMGLHAKHGILPLNLILIENLCRCHKPRVTLRGVSNPCRPANSLPRRFFYIGYVLKMLFKVTIDIFREQWKCVAFLFLSTTHLQDLKLVHSSNPNSPKSIVVQRINLKNNIKSFHSVCSCFDIGKYITIFIT